MSSLLLGNLDRSLSIVPKGHCDEYFLYPDGSVVSYHDSWKVRSISLFPGLYDPIVSNVLEVFIACVDHWIALKNDQKFHRRAVAVEEFTEQIKRICLVGEFVFVALSKIEADPVNREKVSALLSQLLGKTSDTLSQSLQEIGPEAFLQQLDLVTIWRFEEQTPPALTSAILKMAAPLTEVLDSSQLSPNILELPTFYKTLVQRMENPTEKWSLWLGNWWSGAYAPAQNALDKMCREVLEAEDPVYKLINASAKLYLGGLLALFRTGRFPDLRVRACLDELVLASGQCRGEWATEAERQYLSFVGKEETPQDKALQWKSSFVDEHLKRFFPNYYTHTEDAQNVHLMNSLLFHYGERLGKAEFKVPLEDIHVVKKSTSLPYQWPDVFRYLEKAWNETSVESLKTVSHVNKWQTDIGLFLENKVREKIPTVEDPKEFVLTEYFDDQGMLNDRGAIRFLKETLEVI
jgi:hypothetical protein